MSAEVMATITDERLAEMLAGLEGVTPGPWDEAAGLVRAIDGDVAIPIFETREPWKKHRRTSTVVKQEWHNRHHVARCDPDTMRSILTELQSLRSQAGVIEASAWETHKVAGEAAVHSMVIGGVLCRWWGDTEPEGVSLLNNLRPAPIEITEEAIAISRDDIRAAIEAMTETRTASIAGCHEGYGKPEQWGDRLFRSHGGLTASIKALTAALQGETK